MSFGKIWAAIYILTPLALAGCTAKEPVPTTHKTEGAVVHKAGQPYAGGGALEFRDTTTGVRAIGEINKPAGTFVLYTVTSAGRIPGAQEGTYEVTIMPESLDQKSNPPFMLQKKYTVEPGENRLTIELEN